jgi:Rrf2 family protein
MTGMGAADASVTASQSASAATRSTAIDLPFRVSARADYAIRALTEIAAAGGGPITAHGISQVQAIPHGVLFNILAELRRAGLIRSHPGAGYELARPAAAITLAEAIDIIQRDLSRPAIEEITYPGAAAPLRDVWLAVRSSLFSVLGSVTLADVAAGTLPSAVRALAGHPPPVNAHNAGLSIGRVLEPADGTGTGRHGTG